MAVLCKVPVVVATTDLTAQTAAIALTTIYTVPTSADGVYEVSFVSTITTAGTTSVLGGTNGFQIKFTSPTDSVAKTSVARFVGDFSSANTTGTTCSGVRTAYAKAGTAIQYSYDYTSTGTAMNYELHVRVKQL